VEPLGSEDVNDQPALRRLAKDQVKDAMTGGLQYA
jgi:hypothetical protein